MRGPAARATVELGRHLFYDADLSADGTLSCASCHEQRHAFADSVATRPGVHDTPGRRNAPGLVNLDRLASFTWADPRVTTLDAQVLIPIFGQAPIEMGMHGQETEIAARLARDACYRRLFTRAFGTSGIDMPRIATAIAAFERTLVSTDAPIDRGPLPPEARAGAVLFDRDCAGCHAGPALTDNRFHRIDRQINPNDRGLAEATGLAADEGRFRTPSLRNVSVTAPYFHDGRALTLAAALARHGIAADDAATILPFLGSLNGTALMTDVRFRRPVKRCGRDT